jgi:iron complex outermembrane receptor protein
MIVKKRLAIAVSAALGFSAATVITSNTYAQDDQSPAVGDEKLLEEVIVTGSAIKRVDLDNALPVQVLSAADIERTGVSNAAELMTRIPAMQGFLTPGDSVGGSGGGVQTANLRGIGDQYTLTLLNGRRMAPADSGSSIDLSNIPLAAVKRVEILTDGASALYGADAIAGVLNFILLDEVEKTTITLRGNEPEESGGESWEGSIVTGFGKFDQDGYSLVATYSHEEQDPLKAADRDFAKTGFINFRDGGDSLYFSNSSPNSIPGNAYIYTAGYEDYITGFNPYAEKNGSCPQQTTPIERECWFDYTSTLEIMPEHQRDTLFLNGRMKFNDSMTGFATALVSQYEITSRIAPYPSGEVPLPLDSALVAEYVLPYLTPEELAQTGEVTGTWRALPGGGREDKWTTDSYNFTVGVEGTLGKIDYNTAITSALTEIKQEYPNGWLLLDEFVDISSSGAINIFAGQDEITDADRAALEPAIYHGDWDKIKTDYTAFDGTASMPIYEIGGGEVVMAAGLNLANTKYKRTISEANANEALLFLSKDTPYELERGQWGIFGEVLLPITDSWEVTASLRYDDIDAVKDKINGGTIDEGDNDTTYKISTLWNVNDAIALRGSYGTGFKAPSMREIGEPQSDYGVTSGNFACPFPPTDPKAITCLPGKSQYNVYRAGSGDLKFETSEQYTVGTVLTPWDQFEATVDYWNIQIDDQVDRLTEDQIFDNPQTYYDLFTTKTNQATGREELAIIQAAVNIGSSESSGIDYAAKQGFDLNWGQLELGARGTYMIKSDNSLYGSSLGKFGSDDNVVFRNIINFEVTLYHGNWSHNVLVNYRGGYDDQEQEVEITGTGAPLGEGPTKLVQLEVDSYTTTDFQTKYTMFDDSLDLTFGVNNMFDEEPPLTLHISGGSQAVGWDSRYTDAYGRTYYLQAAYSF